MATFKKFWLPEFFMNPILSIFSGLHVQVTFNYPSYIGEVMYEDVPGYVSCIMSLSAV
jgi:hypothetical protein